MYGIMDPSAIRALSLAKSAEFGIDVVASLPLLDSNLKLRELETIIDRILALHCVAAVAAGFDRSKGKTWLERGDLIRALTKEEIRIVAGDLNGRDSITLLVESIWTLAWVIGLVNILDFSD